MEPSKSGLSSHIIYDEAEEDDLVEEEIRIEWSNLIFLPFHRVFKLIILFTVIVKTILGPIQSVYPIVYCSTVLDNGVLLTMLKYYYLYIGDLMYAIDTFFHMVHRQVTEKALRREHLPKSAFLILIDILSLIPFFKMFQSEECAEFNFFPNILTFSEFLIVYRVTVFFSLTATHSLINILLGFTIFWIIGTNCMACFWILLTKHGLCANCKDNLYDWRYFVAYKLNETDESVTTYVYSTAFITNYIYNQAVDNLKPSTLSEYVMVCLFFTLSFGFKTLLLLPKVFAETMLKLKRIFQYHPHVKRLIYETKRRYNTRTYVDIRKFYVLLWRKRSGIACLPDMLTGLPRYLRIDIKQELVWPIFYHSPILRKTQMPVKRMLSEVIISDYKLPGEMFFSGIQSATNLYYIKSGIVQIISSDDTITPILSLTSGTVFGDTSFIFPPRNRKAIVRCLTYCEVLFLTRSDYLKILRKYPEDRKMAIESAIDRVKHAQTLYTCKLNVKGLDRTEDENLNWLRRRWWEISQSIAAWRRLKRNKNDAAIKCSFPPEETIYHCAKYIGQLALCHTSKLQTKSLFTKTTFPWIFVPYSSITVAWNYVVKCTVIMVLIMYPMMLVRTTPLPWFGVFKFWTNVVYVGDICITLLTSAPEQEYQSTKFSSVMFERCKTFDFFLDCLSTFWFEHFCVIVGQPQYYNIVQFNRLIKIYKLFEGKFSQWYPKKSPIITLYETITLVQFGYLYICAHFTYVLLKFIPNLTKSYFFGKTECDKNELSSTTCEMGDTTLGVALQFIMEWSFVEYLPLVLNDIYVGMASNYCNYVLNIFCASLFLAGLYLHCRQATNYREFVTSLKRYYRQNKIHKDLLRRLNRYLVCHWRYFQGDDIMYPNKLKNEPYDIYWKVQGELAEFIIGESTAFIGANKTLIRELAYAAKFLIMPKNSVIFLFGVFCQNVTWIVQGNVKCEYYSDDGELLTVYYERGYLLSPTSVFFGKTSLRTYVACTDCETLYIHLSVFFSILKKYPTEWEIFKSVMAECKPGFEEAYNTYMSRHREYKKTLRKRIFHSRASMANISLLKSSSMMLKSQRAKKIDLSFKDEILNQGESKTKYVRNWMFFRVIVVAISIITASLQGGYGVWIRRPLVLIGFLCDCVAWIDICFKMSLAYYNKDGVVIHDRRKCIFHYVTRGFILDLIGVLPNVYLLGLLMNTPVNDTDAMLINTVSKYAHLYLLYGYFDFMSDKPTLAGAWMSVIKWQVVVLTLVPGLCHYMLTNCITYNFDSEYNLIDLQLKDTCWATKGYYYGKDVTIEDFNKLVTSSVLLTQTGIMRLNFGALKIDRESYIGAVLITIGWLYCHFNTYYFIVHYFRCTGLVALDSKVHRQSSYWTGMLTAFSAFQCQFIFFQYIMCYSLTMLVLASRGDVMFQRGIEQLEKFLISERIDESLIEKVIAYFSYWWIRTNGVNILNISNERLGVVFRQDLNYYFYSETFTALGTVLKGGKSLDRQLASNCTPEYILPGHEIIKEFDLNSTIYIVHRGKVGLYKNGQKVCSLTRGCAFGQFDGTTKARPIQVAATAEENVDLLLIKVESFHDSIPDRVKKNLAKIPTIKFDYLQTEEVIQESPYDTIQYIIRRNPTIKLPWMKEQAEAKRGNWYYRWLYFAWFLGPALSTFTAFLMIALSDPVLEKIFWVNLILDVIHFIHTAFMNVFAIIIVVQGDKCVYRIKKYRIFREWQLYVDFVSLSAPLLSHFLNDWRFDIIRCLRLIHFQNFYIHFCSSFKDRLAPFFLKFCCIILIIHCFTCAWIFLGCRYDNFPVQLANETDVAASYFDSQEWVMVMTVRKEGCAKHIEWTPSGNVFVVPRLMENDYIVSLAFILSILFQSVITFSLALTIPQSYFKIVLLFFNNMFNLWLLSMGISYIYTQYRELYRHDFKVDTLLQFLRRSGVSPIVLETVNKYTQQLWERQRGNWLPSLANSAPICLKQEIHNALYMYHLESIPLFRKLPNYFLRQMSVKLQRNIVFPGKFIVREGDMFAVMYWIHEGEVEKWGYNKAGELKMVSLLNTSGYFGVIPGLFPDAAYKYSYCARTVVDLVSLSLSSWTDLLDGYPNVKEELYNLAKSMKKELGH